MSSEVSSPTNTLSMRIITTEHSLDKPIQSLDAFTSAFRGTSTKRVPVLHLFGTTTRGERMCMHVHGVFPYVYVPLEFEPDETYLRKLAQALDKAISLSLGRPSSYAQHVFSINVVHGMPYYGFHHKTCVFLKIYLYNPMLVARLSDLLLSGAVMGRSFQPHEAHIPYILQFFIDHNLYGMNFINVSTFVKRRSLEEDNSNTEGADDGEPRVAFSGASDGSSTPNVGPLYKVSTCQLEVDILAADILNKQLINDHVGTNPGLLALWEDERKRLRVNGLAEEEIQLEAPVSQDRNDVPENVGVDTGWYERFINMVDALQIAADEDKQSFVMPGSGELSSLNMSDIASDEEVNEQSISQVLNFNTNLTQAAEQMSVRELAELLANQSDSDEPGDEAISYSPRVSPQKGTTYNLDMSLSYSPITSPRPLTDREDESTPITESTMVQSPGSNVPLSGVSEDRSMSILSNSSFASEGSRRSNRSSLYKWSKKMSQDSKVTGSITDTRSPTPVLSQYRLGQSQIISDDQVVTTSRLSGLIQSQTGSLHNSFLFSDDEEDEEAWLQAICSDQARTTTSGFDELYENDMKSNNEDSSDDDLETTIMTQPVWEGAEDAPDSGDFIPQLDGAHDDDNSSHTESANDANMDTSSTFLVSNKTNPLKLTFRKSISQTETITNHGETAVQSPVVNPLKLKFRRTSDNTYANSTDQPILSPTTVDELANAEVDKPKITLSFKSLTQKINLTSEKKKKQKDKSESKKSKKEKSYKKEKHKGKKRRPEKLINNEFPSPQDQLHHQIPGQNEEPGTGSLVLQPNHSHIELAETLTSLSVTAASLPKLTFSKKGNQFTIKNEKRVSPLKLKISQTPMTSLKSSPASSSIKSPLSIKPVRLLSTESSKSSLTSPSAKCDLLSDLTMSSSDDERIDGKLVPTRVSRSLSSKSPVHFKGPLPSHPVDSALKQAEKSCNSVSADRDLISASASATTPLSYWGDLKSKRSGNFKRGDSVFPEPISVTESVTKLPEKAFSEKTKISLTANKPGKIRNKNLLGKGKKRSLGSKDAANLTSSSVSTSSSPDQNFLQSMRLQRIVTKSTSVVLNSDLITVKSNANLQSAVLETSVESTSSEKPLSSLIQSGTLSKTQSPPFAHSLSPMFTERQSLSQPHKQLPAFPQSPLPTLNHSPMFTQNNKPAAKETVSTFTKVSSPPLTKAQSPIIAWGQSPTFSRVQSTALTKAQSPMIAWSQLTASNNTQLPMVSQEQPVPHTKALSPTLTQGQSVTGTTNHQLQTFPLAQQKTFADIWPPAASEIQALKLEEKQEVRETGHSSLYQNFLQTLGQQPTIERNQRLPQSSTAQPLSCSDARFSSQSLFPRPITSPFHSLSHINNHMSDLAVHSDTSTMQDKPTNAAQNSGIIDLSGNSLSSRTAEHGSTPSTIPPWPISPPQPTICTTELAVSSTSAQKPLQNTPSLPAVPVQQGVFKKKSRDSTKKRPHGSRNVPAPSKESLVVTNKPAQILSKDPITHQPMMLAVQEPSGASSTVASLDSSEPARDPIKLTLKLKSPGASQKFPPTSMEPPDAGTDTCGKNEEFDSPKVEQNKIPLTTSTVVEHRQTRSGNRGQFLGMPNELVQTKMDDKLPSALINSDSQSTSNQVIVAEPSEQLDKPQAKPVTRSQRVRRSTSDNGVEQLESNIPDNQSTESVIKVVTQQEIQQQKVIKKPVKQTLPNAASSLTQSATLETVTQDCDAGVTENAPATEDNADAEQPMYSNSDGDSNITSSKPKSFIDRLSQLSQVLGVAPSDRLLEELPIDIQPLVKRNKFGRPLKRGKGRGGGAQGNIPKTNNCAVKRRPRKKAVIIPAARPERPKRVPTRFLVVPDQQKSQEAKNIELPDHSVQKEVTKKEPDAINQVVEQSHEPQLLGCGVLPRLENHKPSIEKKSASQKESRRLILRSKQLRRDNLKPGPRSCPKNQPKPLVLRSAHLPSEHDGRLTLTLRRSVLERRDLPDKSDSKSDTQSVSSKSSRKRNRFEQNRVVDIHSTFKALYAFESDGYARKISLKNAKTFQPSTGLPLTKPPVAKKPSAIEVHSTITTKQITSVSEASEKAEKTKKAPLQSVNTEIIIPKGPVNPVSPTLPSLKDPLVLPSRSLKPSPAMVRAGKSKLLSRKVSPLPHKINSLRSKDGNMQIPDPNESLVQSCKVRGKPSKIQKSATLVRTLPLSLSTTTVPGSSNASSEKPANIAITPSTFVLHNAITAHQASDGSFKIAPKPSTSVGQRSIAPKPISMPPPAPPQNNKMVIIISSGAVQQPSTILQPIATSTQPILANMPESPTNDRPATPEPSPVTHGFQDLPSMPKNKSSWKLPSNSRVQVKQFSHPVDGISLRNCSVKIASMALDSPKTEGVGKPTITRTAKLRNARSARTVNGIVEDRDLMLKRFLAMPELVGSKRPCYTPSSLSVSDSYCEHANNDWQIDYDHALHSAAIMSESNTDQPPSIRLGNCELGDSSHVTDDSTNGTEGTLSPRKALFDKCTCLECVVEKDVQRKGSTLLAQGLSDPSMISKALNQCSKHLWNNIYESWRTDADAIEYSKSHNLRSEAKHLTVVNDKNIALETVVVENQAKCSVGLSANYTEQSTASACSREHTLKVVESPATYNLRTRSCATLTSKPLEDVDSQLDFQIVNVHSDHDAKIVGNGEGSIGRIAEMNSTEAHACIDTASEGISDRSIPEFEKPIIATKTGSMETKESHHEESQEEFHGMELTEESPRKQLKLVLKDINHILEKIKSPPTLPLKVAAFESLASGLVTTSESREKKLTRSDSRKAAVVAMTNSTSLTRLHHELLNEEKNYLRSVTPILPITILNATSDFIISCVHELSIDQLETYSLLSSIETEQFGANTVPNPIVENVNITTFKLPLVSTMDCTSISPLEGVKLSVLQSSSADRENDVPLDITKADVQNTTTESMDVVQLIPTDTCHAGPTCIDWMSTLVDPSLDRDLEIKTSSVETVFSPLETVSPLDSYEETVTCGKTRHKELLQSVGNLDFAGTQLTDCFTGVLQHQVIKEQSRTVRHVQHLADEACLVETKMAIPVMTLVVPLMSVTSSISDDQFRNAGSSNICQNLSLVSVGPKVIPAETVCGYSYPDSSLCEGVVSEETQSPPTANQLLSRTGISCWDVELYSVNNMSMVTSEMRAMCTISDLDASHVNIGLGIQQCSMSDLIHENIEVIQNRKDSHIPPVRSTDAVCSAIIVHGVLAISAQVVPMNSCESVLCPVKQSQPVIENIQIDKDIAEAIQVCVVLIPEVESGPINLSLKRKHSEISEPSSSLDDQPMDLTVKRKPIQPVPEDQPIDLCVKRTVPAHHPRMDLSRQISNPITAVKVDEHFKVVDGPPAMFGYANGGRGGAVYRTHSNVQRRHSEGMQASTSGITRHSTTDPVKKRSREKFELTQTDGAADSPEPSDEENGQEEEEKEESAGDEGTVHSNITLEPRSTHKNRKTRTTPNLPLSTNSTESHTDVRLGAGHSPIPNVTDTPLGGDSDDTCWSDSFLLDRNENEAEIDIVYGTPPETWTSHITDNAAHQLKQYSPTSLLSPSASDVELQQAHQKAKSLTQTDRISESQTDYCTTRLPTRENSPLYTSIKRFKPDTDGVDGADGVVQADSLLSMLPDNARRFRFGRTPPSQTDVESTSLELGLAVVENVYPFFRDYKDCRTALADPMSKQCNKRFSDICPQHLPKVILRGNEGTLLTASCGQVRRFEPVKSPPSLHLVQQWIQKRATLTQDDEKSSSEDTATERNPTTPSLTTRTNSSPASSNDFTVIVAESPDSPEELSMILGTPPEPVTQSGARTESKASEYSKTSQQSSRSLPSRHHSLFSTQIMQSLNECEASQRPPSSLRRSSAFEDRPTDQRSLSGTSELGGMSYSSVVTSQYPEQSVNITQAWSHDKSGIQGISGRNKAADTQQLLKQMASHNTSYNDIVAMSMEAHISTRGSLRPDPAYDKVEALFLHVHHDNANDEKFQYVLISLDGVCQQVPVLTVPGVTVEVVQCLSEFHMMGELLKIIRKHDPDLLIGWEVHNLSWGYLLRRASVLKVNLANDMSRIPKPSNQDSCSQQESPIAHGSEFARVGGRVLVNMWRVMRHQMGLGLIPALTNYNFENVVYHILNMRIPRFMFLDLTGWYTRPKQRKLVFDYYLRRVQLLHSMEQQIDFIGQTSEFARVYGIEFCDVLIKGTQYKVESMMLRIAKPLNFVAVSPNIQQRVRMNPPECIQLTLEPESQFYADPVIVLDFQSLYPSIMIAHNYCFSTCLGHVSELERAAGEDFKFGCTSLRVPAHVLTKLKDHINVSPNGVAFVKQHVRKGVISRMVEEILETRLMVKRCMSRYKSDKGLHKLLHARQLGLKLIANVTFGYAAANFSGRMPCVEVGDSIVRKARETLENAIKMVNESNRWKSRVVYGDTDSLFVLVPGRSLEAAFKVGEEIRDAVSAANPKPMKLKLEKVYMGCVLQTKKRYAGFMYESADQKEPVFDAKGIETVRRDSIPAVSKILEKSLTGLFATRDLSEVKSYVQKQLSKILEGTAKLQDFIFSKEYRGERGYKASAKVPALILARRRLLVDRWSEPLTGERVPYVIVCGAPGTPLYHLIREPQDVLANPQLKLNTVYYVTRVILPPLHRAFSLLGVNVQSWYEELPKVRKYADESTVSKVKSTLPQYFSSSKCLLCEGGSQATVCCKCLTSHAQQTVIALNKIVGRQLQLEHTASQICRLCSNIMGDQRVPCISLDCPVLYKRTQLHNQRTLAGPICDKYLGKINDY